MTWYSIMHLLNALELKSENRHLKMQTKEKSCHIRKKLILVVLKWKSGENLTGHHKVTNNIVNYILAGITDFACKFSSFAPGLCIKNLTMLELAVFQSDRLHDMLLCFLMQASVWLGNTLNSFVCSCFILRMSFIIIC